MLTEPTLADLTICATPNTNTTMCLTVSRCSVVDTPYYRVLEAVLLIVSTAVNKTSTVPQQLRLSRYSACLGKCFCPVAVYLGLAIGQDHRLRQAELVQATPRTADTASASLQAGAVGFFFVAQLS